MMTAAGPPRTDKARAPMSGAAAPLDVLIVAGFFPPHAPLAATRTPALARFLLERGHRVRVLAARNPGFTAVADHGLPEGLVHWAEAPGPVSLKALASGLARGRRTAWRSLREPGALLRRASAWPDLQAGWLAPACALGDRLVAERRPDMVFATVPPHTGLLVAHHLHKAHGLPWVAEFRDLWVDHPYYDGGALRRRLDTLVEHRALRTAAGLVTVTEGWRRLLSDAWPQPVCLARNGFEDVPEAPEDAPPPPDPDEVRRLTLIYAGVLYGNKRDPRPLFKALSLLGPRAEEVRVHFYGTEAGQVEAMAAAEGLSAPVVQVHPAVKRARLLALQRRADVLLLLRWNDAREDSVLPGKLFEYIGCRRPILAVGSTTGEAAAIIEEGGLGLAAADPHAIAERLRLWLDAKAAGRAIPPPPEEAVAPHARAVQFATLERFLAGLVHPDDAAAAARANEA